MRWHAAIIWMLAALSCVGCTGIRQWQRTTVYGLEADRIARRELPAEKSGRSGRHYSRGFKAGYVRFAMTGEERPPILPPSEYQGVHYENQQGQQAIEDWYSGFERGVIAAQNAGRDDFRLVARRHDHPQEILPVVRTFHSDDVMISPSEIQHLTPANNIPTGGYSIKMPTQTHAPHDATPVSTEPKRPIPQPRSNMTSYRSR